MVELDDNTFFMSMLWAFANDEDAREFIISHVREKSYAREEIEMILDTLCVMCGKDPLDNSGLDPELYLSFARRLAEISGKTLEQVLAESDALERQGQLLF